MLPPSRTPRATGPVALLVTALAVIGLATTLASAPVMARPAGHHPHRTHHAAHASHAGHAGRGVGNPHDPRRRLGLFVDPYMPAAQAGSAYDRIGRRAQPLWITDYYNSPSAARAATSGYASRAVQAHKTPMMVIYAIPDRDCGGDSSGGMPTAAAYRAWVAGAAAGMRGTHPMVFLEPDAVPFIGDPSCSGVDTRQREGLIAFAAKRLKAAGAWVYIDAGHSGWRTPTAMAHLLKASGMRYARGFTTNIGNFRPTGQEQRYASALKKALAKVGLRHRTNIIDTSRNGARTPPSMTDICNPTVARLGRAPQLQFKGTFDGYLWIKHPGESDGDSETSYRDCHGGPSSGTWWPAGAQSLMQRKG